MASLAFRPSERCFPAVFLPCFTPPSSMHATFNQQIFRGLHPSSFWRIKTWFVEIFQGCPSPSLLLWKGLCVSLIHFWLASGRLCTILSWSFHFVHDVSPPLRGVCASANMTIACTFAVNLESHFLYFPFPRFAIPYPVAYFATMSASSFLFISLLEGI